MEFWHQNAMSLSLLILCCGDVETNPGPPKYSQEQPKSTLSKAETIRKFIRYCQVLLVELIYVAGKKEIPNSKVLYKQDPPGWDSSDGIKFESICNTSKGGNEIFDKLIELCKRVVQKIPDDIQEVIRCYEALRESTGKNEETEQLKNALENFISQRKFLKEMETFVYYFSHGENLNTFLKKMKQLVKEGVIDSSVNDKVISSAADFTATLRKREDNLMQSPAGVKRPATQNPETSAIEEDGKKRKKFRMQSPDRKTPVQPKVVQEGTHIPIYVERKDNENNDASFYVELHPLVHCKK
uniref:Uncharacterized protein LOC111133325 isoform X2 n=1 Tax=Crassostrea virginica TaxID=6565 RepID=A0A8B8EAZ9_CRAVI|nr:uncharacterized protein LOC111133325 isoform X2 [Crassostrea virginica]